MSEIKMELGMKEETFLFIPMYIKGPRGSKMWRSWRLRVYMEAAWPEGRRVWQGSPWLGWGSDCTPPSSRTDPLCPHPPWLPSETLSVSKWQEKPPSPPCSPRFALTWPAQSPPLLPTRWLPQVMKPQFLNWKVGPTSRSRTHWGFRAVYVLIQKKRKPNHIASVQGHSGMS